MNKNWLIVFSVSVALTILKIMGLTTLHWIWTTGPLLGILLYFSVSIVASILVIVGPIPVILTFLLCFLMKYVIIRA